MVVDTVINFLGPYAPIGVLVFRNLYGWVHEATKSGSFEKYDVKLLLKNLVGLGSLAFLVSLGVPQLTGVDSTALVAALDAIRNDVFKK